MQTGHHASKDLRAAQLKAEVVRLARKGLDAEQIADRINGAPDHRADPNGHVEVEQVAEILDVLAYEQEQRRESRRLDRLNRQAKRDYDRGN